MENMWIHLCFLFSLLETVFSVDLTYRIEEGHSIGTYVGDISADIQLLESAPARDRTLIWFSQLQKDATRDSHLFNVSRAGKLYTAQTLDAESLCTYNSECYETVDIAVQKKESFIKILEIKVIILDINDNHPQFPFKQINHQFSESDGKGTTKSIPNAIDNDVGIRNSQITYQLRKNRDEPFRLSVSKKVDGTSKLGIVLEKPLDREVKDTYNLQVIAKDGGYSQKQGILDVKISVADVNDNSPVFSKDLYNVSIRNTHKRDIPVVVLSASDSDDGKNGKVSFQYSSKTSELSKSYFTLNKNTGEIFLQRKFSSQQKHMYKLLVEATDGGIPPLSSAAIVLVNVINQENNPPLIDVNFISQSKGISEGTDVGSFIAFVKVTDEDAARNGEVNCDLEHDILQLQTLGRKKYKVVVKNRINRETQSNMQFTIVCRDNGIPPLETRSDFSLQVIDINDVQPQFTKSVFRFLTYENEEANFPVGFINATDPDLGPGGQLSYSLSTDNNILLPFEISDFGFISTRDSLDREQQDIYEFQVLVKDNGSPSLSNTAKVVVEVMDENDNAPYFTFPSVKSFSLDVYYNPQSENDITTLRASDRDSHVNAFLRYEILGGNDRQLFSVSPYTGVVSFSRTVYQNDAGLYELQFIVKDSGSPMMSATTTLSVSLTVSNKTSKMYTALDVQSEDKIHINFVIITIVAAVIVSVAIVVSITICIIQRNNQRDIQYYDAPEVSNKFLSESKQSEYMSDHLSTNYNIPVTMVIDQSTNRNSPATLPKRKSPSDYKAQSWKGSSLGVQLHSNIQGSNQSLPCGIPHHRLHHLEIALISSPTERTTTSNFVEQYRC
ncbi:protocadherin gamma-A4-like isoform X2 [Octopus sinensis]|uniref:Protocadherin gamma-A4-like isoform X2 n=1 Tax=Octopus sinensis TaxID=2607531 RepID=A0A7E6FA89_9MOLL|nr:protocadherin gamma-A4-like isoform X2 [Octopus sinensis]